MIPFPEPQEIQRSKLVRYARKRGMDGALAFTGLTRPCRERTSRSPTSHLFGNTRAHVQRVMFRGLSILSWDLQIDTLGVAEVRADVAITTDVGCVGRKYDAELAPGYISDRRVVVGERYMPEALEQNDPSALG